MFQSLLAKCRPGRERRVEVGGIENEVGADRHAAHHGVAQRVGAVPADHFQRIDPVAE